MTRLDAMHHAMRRSYGMARLVVVTRILLALGFIPTGLVKILGLRFTVLPPEHPVGAFFEAMFQTGAYWQFLGWMQLLTGALLLWPRTAAVAAVGCFAIMLNIFVITLSLDFAGTPVVTGLMLLATLVLLAWDFHLWKPALFAAPYAPPPPLRPLRAARLERTILTIGTLAGLLFFLGTRNLVPPLLTKVGFIAGALAAVALGGVWIAQDVARYQNTGGTATGEREA